MAFYIIDFFLFAIFAYLYSKSDDISMTMCLKIICFLIIFLPAACRYGIGTDYFGYVRHFEKINSGNNLNVEIGWQFLNKLVFFLGFRQQFVFAIASFITYFAIMRVSKKESFFVFIIYYMLLYTSSYNTVRNAISIAFCFWGYLYLIKNKFILCLIVTFVGSLFHSSGLVFIPIYFFANWVRINKHKTLFISIIIFFFLNVFDLTEIILNLPILENFRWVQYATNNAYNRQTVVRTGLGVLLRWITLFFTYLLIDENECNSKEFSSMSFLFLGLWFSDILATKIVIFTRLKICFFIAYLALFKLLSKETRNPIKILGRLYCVIQPFIFVFLINLKNNENEVIPYAMFF